MRVRPFVFPSLVLATIWFMDTGLEGHVCAKESNTSMDNAKKTDGNREVESGEVGLTVQVMQPGDEGDEKERFRVGMPIMVLVNIKNASEDTYFFVNTLSRVDVRFTVLDAQENLVPSTLHGKRIHDRSKRDDPRRGSNIAYKVLPGKTLEFEFNLSRQFDLSLTGTYTVRASCSLQKLISVEPESYDYLDIKSDDVVFELR